MEVIRNIKNVLKNVKLIKDKNISKQYEEVQKVDDFTDYIKDLINPSLDLNEQKVVPKLTYFNNIQKYPKAIQSSSDLHSSTNNGDRILNEQTVSIPVVEVEPSDEEKEEEERERK